MLIRFLSHFFAVSFLLNFFWEISQMGAYSTMGMGQIADINLFIVTHWWVSFKDALIIVGLYLFIGLIISNWYWGRHFNSRRLGLLIVLGFLIAASLEYYHVNINHSWSYNSAMPLVPFIGVGLWPILQMIILPATAIVLSRRNLFSL